MQPEPRNQSGKTLWEMFMERLQGGSNGAGIPFSNPLDLRVGAPVPIAHANGPGFVDYDFTVQEIREYTRRLGGQEFRFTDYALKGINRKSFDADDILVARVRAVPNSAGGQTTLLLSLYDEFAFAQEFLEVVKDDTGVFEVEEEEGGPKTVFARINEVRESYEAAVLVVAATTPEGKAAAGKTAPVKLQYWDYWRDADIGNSNTAKEFLFVEMNDETGWFQLWRGREFFT